MTEWTGLGIRGAVAARIARGGWVGALMALSTLASLAVAPVQAQQIIHVAPDGDDGSNGCCDPATAKGGPVQTLGRALALVRAQRAEGGWPKGGVIVQVQPGVYPMRAPVSLDAGVSGEPGAPLIIRASTPGRPRPVRFVGSVPLQPAAAPQPGSAAAAGVAAAARSAAASATPAVVARAPQGADAQVTADSLVIRQGRPLQLARWPNEGFGRVSSVAGDVVRIGAAGRVPATGPGTRLAGFLLHDWLFDFADVGSRLGDALLVSDAAKRVKPNQRVFLTGTSELIDRPDEFAIDAQANRVFVHGSAGSDPALSLAVTPSLLTGKGARHVRVESVAFCDTASHAIELSDVDTVAFVDVEICNTGGWGLRMNGRASGVRGSFVHDTGLGGVYLFGGVRRDLTPGAMFVEHSVFERQGRRVWSYSPGISIEGVGGTVVGNILNDNAHVALMFSGSDQRIAFNEIHDVVKEAGDMGAIYAGRDWTARGNIVQGNLVYDIPGPGISGSRGVYLDDQFSSARVVNNLFSNVRNGVYVGGGRDNIVRHNLFFSSDPSIHFDARGLDDQAMITGIGPTLQRRLTEVPIDSPVYRERFPELARIRDEQPMAPLGNRIADNVIVDGTPLFLLGPSPKKFLDGPVGERLSVRSAKAWHGRPQRQWIALLEARVPEAAQYFPWDEFEAANRKGQAAR